MGQHRVTRKQAPPKKEAQREPKTLRGACSDLLEKLKDRRRQQLTPEPDTEGEDAVMVMIYGPDPKG